MFTDLGLTKSCQCRITTNSAIESESSLNESSNVKQTSYQGYFDQ